MSAACSRAGSPTSTGSAAAPKAGSRSTLPTAAESLPGIELVEMKESDWCCGSAGVYNLTHPQISEEALGWKVRNIIDSGAQVIASANPGCILQVGMGLQRAGHDIPVVHVMDLLGWAYGDDEQRPPIVRRAMA